MPSETIKGQSQEKAGQKRLYDKLVQLYTQPEGGEDTLKNEGIVYARESKFRSERAKVHQLDQKEFALLCLYALSKEKSGGIPFSIEKIASATTLKESDIMATRESLFTKLNCNTFDQTHAMSEVLGILPLTVPQTSGALLPSELIETRKLMYSGLNEYQMGFLMLDLKGSSDDEIRKGLAISDTSFSHRRSRIVRELKLNSYENTLLVTRFLHQIKQLSDPEYQGYIQSPLDLITSSTGINPPFSKSMIAVLLETAQYFSHNTTVGTTNAYSETDAAHALNQLIGDRSDYYWLERFVLRIQRKNFDNLPKSKVRTTERRVLTLTEAHQQTLATFRGDEIDTIREPTGEVFKLSTEMRQMVSAIKAGKGTIVDISFTSGLPENVVRDMLPKLLNILGVERLFQASARITVIEEERKQRRIRKQEASPRIYGYYRVADENATEPPPTILTVRDLYNYLHTLPQVRWAGYTPFIVVNIGGAKAVRIDIDLNDPEMMSQFGIIVEKQSFEIPTVPGKRFVRDILGPTMIKVREVNPDENF